MSVVSAEYFSLGLLTRQGLGDGFGKLFAVLERGGEQKILFFAQILFQVL